MPTPTQCWAFPIWRRLIAYLGPIGNYILFIDLPSVRPSDRLSVCHCVSCVLLVKAGGTHTAPQQSTTQAYLYGSFSFKWKKTSAMSISERRSYHCGWADRYLRRTILTTHVASDRRSVRTFYCRDGSVCPSSYLWTSCITVEQFSITTSCNIIYQVLRE